MQKQATEENAKKEFAQKKSIVIAGASGFVGSYLIRALKKHYKIIALSRFPKESTDPDVEWRTCDLYSMGSTFQALKGAHKAIYLVHSMIPQDRLFQAHFSDTDLLIADNFIHSCRSNNIEQIVYLGGLIPKGYVSDHLKSRLEVEELFENSGLPFTLLRAGMIVGPGGSSFEILMNLVKNLKGMLLPRWTERITQTLYIDDLVSIIQENLKNPKHNNRVFELTTGENMSYQQLIVQCASFLKRKRYFIPVPIESKNFSKLWVSIFGQTNYELVSPLIDSLLCDLKFEATAPELEQFIQTKTFREMMKKTIETPDFPKKTFRNVPHQQESQNTVRSIQRLPSLQNVKAFEVSKAYFEWLPKKLQSVLKVKVVDDTLSFHTPFFTKPLLVLKMIQDEFVLERHKFLIIGGLLVSEKNRGWLEFRVLNHGTYVLSAIHDFVPSLPWYLYTNTQAQVHQWVMNEFSKHLSIK